MLRPALSLATRPHPLALLLAAAASLPALAHEDGATELQAVEVKGEALHGTGAAYSATRLEHDDIRDRRVARPQDLFRLVPGMNLTGYGLPGVADQVALRGFGNGGHGGDIGFVIDGIPLNEAMSHADGYADLNVIVPLELERMTVLRGPVSALYGNYNRAGTVTLQTRKGGAYRDLDLSLGSYGTVDLQAALGAGFGGNQQLNLAAQHYRSDGFRDQSAGERSTLAGRWAVQATSDLEVAVSARAHEAKADNPGYLTRAQFKDDPYGKDPRTQNDGAEKGFYTLRTDLNYQLAPELKLLSFAYATRQDFTRWFSRGGAAAPSWRQREETYERDVLGAGFNLNGHHHLGAAGQLSWVGGVETFSETTDYLKYENTRFRRRIGTAEFDRRFKLDNLAVFGEAALDAHRLFKPSIGLRWDRFTGDCDRRGAETSAQPCARMDAVEHLSPKLGVRSQVADGVELRASWTEGFALANDMAKYSLGARHVDPNVFRQTELGANVRLSSQLVLDLAAYHLRSSDEINYDSVANEYINAGSTRRTGVEVSALWAPADRFDLSLNWASAHSKVLENPNSSLEGKRVTAVPRYTATVEANWRPAPGWRGTVTWRRVGSFAVTQDNTQTYGGYSVFDLGAAYTFPGAGAYTLYATIDNVANREYATAVSTVGYATAAPRTLRVGAQLSF